MFADDERVIALTRTWVERAVIGLNLCPFARIPLQQGRVHLVVSHAEDEAAALSALTDALRALDAADPAICETSLLILPQMFADFLDFNDFFDTVDACVTELELDGVIQVASFHPDYRFADSSEDDPANCSNRSPFPTLHLLRESSIEQGVEAIGDPARIFERNIETLRALGWDGWEDLWRDPPR